MNRQSRLLKSRRRRSAFATFLQPQPLTVTAIIVGSMLALGAQHVEVIACAALASSLACLNVLRTGSLRVPAPAWVLFGLAAWTILQTLPLPAWLVGFLSPASFDVWARTADVMGESRSWLTLSLDPKTSTVEALKWFSYATFFVAAEGMARRIGWRVLIAIVFCSAVLLALLTLVHGLAGASRVYGLYAPVFGAGSWGMSPLLNANNRAGYLNLGAFVAFSFMVRRRHGDLRWFVCAGIMILVGVSLLTASRGGAAALFAGVCCIALLGVQRLLHADPSERRRLGLLIAAPVAVGLCGGVALAALGGNHMTWQSLRSEGTEKLSIVSWSAGVLRDFPLFGVGRGGLESVFPAYRESAGNIRYQYAENFLAQWVTEWGLVVGLAALATLFWMYRPRGTERMEASILRIAAAVLLLHNLVDLALELAAIGFALTAVLAALWVIQDPKPLPQTKVRPLVLGVGVVTPVLLVAALVLGRPTPVHQRLAFGRKVHQLARTDQRATRDLIEQLKSAIRWSPAEPYYPLLVGQLVSLLGKENPFPWFGLALERDMMSGRAHLGTAVALGRRRLTNQALLELRLAVERDSVLAEPAAQYALAWARSLDEFRRAVPRDHGGGNMMLRAAREPRFRGERLAVLTEAAQLNPTSVAIRVELVESFMRAAADRRDPCQASALASCERRATVHTTAISKLLPDASLGLEYHARLLVALGRNDEAMHELSLECSRFSGPASCWRTRIALQRGKRITPELLHAIKAYTATACTSSLACAEADSWVGRVLADSGDWIGALQHYARAAESLPSAARWVDVARAARAAGQPLRARDALARAGTESDAGKVGSQIAAERERLSRAPSQPPHF